jgi:hypothetical protein
MRKVRTDPRLIREQVLASMATGPLVQKRLACGHVQAVPESTDASKEICWICRSDSSAGSARPNTPSTTLTDESDH